MNKMLIALVLGVFLFAGCTGSSLLGGIENGIAPGGDSGTLLKSGSPAYAEDSSEGDRMVVKTGNVRVLVQQGTLEDKFAKLKLIAIENEGEITGVSYDEYPAEKGYYLTMKIAPKNFENVLAKIKELGEVKSVDTNLEDVTTQYQDLEVRIKNLREELDALNALYNKTDNIEDILKIRSEINNVETQLELYEQQKLDLERRVAKSTLTVYVYEEKPAIEKDLLIPLGDLAGVFFGAMGFAITVIVGIIGFLLPGLLVLAIIIGLWKIARRKKK